MLLTLTCSPGNVLRFPEATILCADISGFTAWASIRQPSQVFTLLESIFKEFDTMANKRKVFKVRDRAFHMLAIMIFGLRSLAKLCASPHLPGRNGRRLLRRSGRPPGAT
jgi:class 3 adenylate cyclase